MTTEKQNVINITKEEHEVIKKIYELSDREIFDCYYASDMWFLLVAIANKVKMYK